MGVYMVPPIGAGVWVEFEHGDPEQAGLGRLPLGFAIGHVRRWRACRKPGRPEHRDSIAVAAGHHRQRHAAFTAAPIRSPGGIILKSTTGAMIVVNDGGIYISNGKGAMITMIGTGVDLNSGALTILK